MNFTYLKTAICQRYSLVLALVTLGGLQPLSAQYPKIPQDIAHASAALMEAAERHAADYAMRRVTVDADVANACLFLASDVSRQITGVDLPVDGGWAML